MSLCTSVVYCTGLSSAVGSPMMLCAFSDICLQPGTTGGIESDFPIPSLDVTDGKCNGKKSHSAVHNGACPFICIFVQLVINEVQLADGIVFDKEVKKTEKQQS